MPSTTPLANIGRRWMLLAILAVFVLQAPAALADTKVFFFLHHSTGRNLIDQSNMRDLIGVLSMYEETQVRVWDHDYNSIGLRDAEGDYTGYSYEIPDNNTNPEGLHALWTTANAARDSILARYDVIAFKSCYHPTCRIVDDDQLQQYKDWYLEIRDELGRHPDKLFVIMSPPPLHRLMSDPEWADRARDFANWLGSDEFLTEQPNLVYFDLFDRLASPDDGSADRNTLRYDYEITHDVANGHPNELANMIVGPAYASFLVTAVNRAEMTVDVPRADAAMDLQAFPNPFNPATSIQFTLPETQAVRLRLYDLSGRLMNELVADTMQAGGHSVPWDGRDHSGQRLPSGIYICRLQSASGQATLPLTLIK